MHGLLERWASESEERKELFETLKEVRLRDGLELPEIPVVDWERIHTCIICNGVDKDGKNMSFKKEKLHATRYHYAACLYDSGVYFEMYPPGEENSNDDGSPRDALGREVKYWCGEQDCTLKRKMGYKEFVVHMANDHGGLKIILQNHENTELQKITPMLERT